jgi:glycosyltransferase involved in cell wall biosynthesis
MDGALFLDQSGTFKVYSEYSARQNCVGLVGRLFDEKGIREFIQAIPGILHWNKNVSFMIIGTGNLDQEVEKLLSTSELEQQVTWIRGVPHDEVSKYLNTMRLLVVPSTDEGLPMIILEALGCGTPVLATPVGCIPDVIHDQETGFILPDNAPETIEQGVIRAMSHSDLSRIISNGLDLLHKNYSLESSTARYRNILNSLNQA